MDLTLKYSKTSKGAKAVLAKSRALPSNCMLVLSNIDGKLPASIVQTKLQLNEEKFSKALAQLLEEGYIQVVQDFGPTIFDLNSAIEVSEISTEEFLKLELPEEQSAPSPQQLEAEARAKAYAEEQARKEAQAREQEEAERKLLMVTDILAKSGHKIDIEKLAEPKRDITTPAAAPREPAPTVPSTPPIVKAEPEDLTSLDFTQGSSIPIPESSSATRPVANTIAVPPAAEEASPKVDDEEALRKQREQHEQASRQKEAAAQAKRDADAQAKAEAERLASEASERRAREKAEAEAKAREEEQRKAEEKARKAEEKARKEEERRALKEAEAARKKAELQAREEARARARAEAERKAREEAERKAKEKAAAAERAREAAEAKARQRAALEAQRAAEAEAKAEADRKAREEARIRKEALATEKAAAKEAARREAEARAIVRAENWARRRAAIGNASVNLLPRLVAVGRPILIGLAVLTIALLATLQFVSLSLWSSSVEQMMTRSIGEPVQIRDLRVSLWPRPHLILEDVSAGPLGDITARTVEIYPEVTSLWSSHTNLHTVNVEGLSLEQASLRRPIDWIASSVKQQAFRPEHISLQNVTIKVPELELPAFDAEASLDDHGQLTSATISANNIAAEIKPESGQKILNIQAQNWQLPVGAPLVFDELSAKGTIRGSQLDLSKVEGSLYGGSLNGRLNIDWSDQWHASGNFELAKVDLAQATPVISDHANLRGRVLARADFAASGSQVHQLMMNPAIQARFEAEQGEVGGLDLARAASGREQVGGVTRFDVFSGNWLLKNGQYQLTQLDLKAGSLSAQGEIGISPDQDLTGKVQTRLDLSSRQLQGRYNISGKLGNARISR